MDKFKPLLQTIKENIDSQGSFAGYQLFDHPWLGHRFPPGSLDGTFGDTPVPQEEQRVQQVMTELQRMQKRKTAPSHPVNTTLYQLICQYPLLVKGELLTQQLEALKDPTFLYDLGKAFFTKGCQVEVLRFAYLCLGIAGMEKIKRLDPDLWQDLITAAKYEELTFYFVQTTMAQGFIDQEACLELLYTTKGWGRIFILSFLDKVPLEAQEWLVRQGYQIPVDCPYTAGWIMKLCNLEALLDQETIDQELYQGAATLCNNFLAMVNGTLPEIWQELLKINVPNLGAILKHLQRHSTYLATVPEEMLNLLGLSVGLQNLAEENNYQFLSHGEISSLLTAFDQLVLYRSWQDYVEANLFKEGFNSLLADFAFQMEMDIWPLLLDYWVEHPEDTSLFPYLLYTEDTDRIALFMVHLEDNLELYVEDPEALLVPLQFLRQCPGLGEEIIAAALGSIYEWPRVNAAMTLSYWPHEEITPYLDAALDEAIGLSCDESTKRLLWSLKMGTSRQPLEERGFISL